MKKYFCAPKKRSMPLFFLILCSIAFLPPPAGAQESANDGYEGLSIDPQADLQNAQATMASLFGKDTVMAVPPQIARGTIALPSFDSSEMVIEKEALEKDDKLKTGN